MPRSNTCRVNLYLLPSGRVIARRQKYALAGGQRIGAGIHPQELAALYRLFVKTRDRGYAVIEAIGYTIDGRPGLPAAMHRPLVQIYAERVRRIRAGERVGPAMLEAA